MSACDNSPTLCRANNKTPVLPRNACLPINRCNLPAVILGSPTYHDAPMPLALDGVAELHHDLFRRLDSAAHPSQRAAIFTDYLTVHFRLNHPEDAGYNASRGGRCGAHYASVLRGWSVNADSREGAVMKGWVESRFGLTPRFHGEPLRDPSAPAYRHYLEMRAAGLYGTHALEAQLDLVYSYCQYELTRAYPADTRLTLYRGVNRMGDFEQLGGSASRPRLLLNNLNSFTAERERADEFGDFILTVAVPTPLIVCYCGLLPGVLRGENEYLALGGVYDVALSTL